MTLIITAVAPDAIVMGTDSAIALRLNNAPSNLVYSGLKKQFTWAPIGIGVSICGTFPLYIEKQSFCDWMQGWYLSTFDNQGVDPDVMAKTLCSDLDRYVDKRYPSPVELHVAMWVTSDKYPGTKIPIAFEIKRINDNYIYSGLLGHDVIQLIYNYRKITIPKILT